MTERPSPTDEDRELIEAIRATWPMHSGFGPTTSKQRALVNAAADRLESLLSDRAKLEAALQRLEQIVGITLDKDFGFWSSSAQNERRAELYPAWVYAKRTLDALNRSTDRAT